MKSCFKAFQLIFIMLFLLQVWGEKHVALLNDKRSPGLYKMGLEWVTRGGKWCAKVNVRQKWEWKSQASIYKDNLIKNWNIW